MTAANLTLTHSKAQTVTSVSPLDRESSSKNDISLRSALKKQRAKTQEQVEQDVKQARLALKNRLNYLKKFSRGESSKQVKDVNALKERSIIDVIKNLIPNRENQTYQLRELYELLIELNDHAGLGPWRITQGANEIVLFASYHSIFPGVRFICNDNGFSCHGFNYNIRIRNA